MPSPAPSVDLDIAHVARLARLALTSDEARRLAGDLQHILAYVAKLNEVDVEGVEPMTHAAELVMAPLALAVGGEAQAAIVAPLRGDEVQPSLGAEAGLAMAPRREGPFVEVPRIIDEAS